MGKLDDISGLIEIDESELGTSLNVSRVTKALNDNEDSEDVILTNQTDEGLIEVDEEPASVTKNSGKTEIEEDEVIADDADLSPAETFKAFTTLLKSNGALPHIEDKEIDSVDSATAIVNLLNKQLNIVNKEWQDNYKKNLLGNLMKDGYISEQQIVKNVPKSYSQEDIKSDEKAAMETIRSFYKSKDIPDAQIETIIKNTIDLEEEALRLLPYIDQMKEEHNKKLAEQLKQKEEAEITQKQVFEKTLKDNVYNYKEFIPGRQLSDQDKESVFGNIVPVLNKINSDLGRYAPILAYLDKYNLLEGDMSKILAEATTKKVSKFEELITSKKRSASHGTSFDNVAGKSKSKTGYNIYG